MHVRIVIHKQIKKKKFLCLNVVQKQITTQQPPDTCLIVLVGEVSEIREGFQNTEKDFFNDYTPL